MNEFLPPPRRSDRPRRVRGGERLGSAEPPAGTNAASRLWLQLFQGPTTDPAIAGEALEYARAGQVHRLRIEPGVIAAAVQGRSQRPYQTRLEIAPLDGSAWERIVAHLSAEAGMAAALLAGRFPDEAVESLTQINAAIIDPRSDRLRPACSCTVRAHGGEWCKHSLALAWITAAQLDESPLLALTIRGLSSDEFLERLRLRRSSEASGGRLQIVHEPDASELSEAAPSLQANVAGEAFWVPPTDPRGIVPAVTRSSVRHALLERLGPAPFTTSRFPLSGFLATCYNVVIESLAREEAGDGSDSPSDST